jgi:hypothetical protein
MIKPDRAISQLLRRITAPVALFALASSLAVSLHSAAAPGQSRTRVERPSREGLTMEERIACQRAIEEVYWRHRIWPKDNAKPKRALDQVVPPSVLQAKVEDYLQKSRVLALSRPITGEDLQAEIKRMARQTKQPEMLRELWTALGNDPYVIAECLARPALAEKLISFYRETRTDDAKIGDRLQIAQQNTDLFGRSYPRQFGACHRFSPETN